MSLGPQRNNRLPGPWLFPTRRQGQPRPPGSDWADYPVHASTVQRWFTRARTRAGLRRRATPHDMRRAYATHLLEDGVGIRVVQVLLGHADPRTTAGYLSVSAEVVRKAPCPWDSMAP